MDVVSGAGGNVVNAISSSLTGGMLLCTVTVASARNFAVLGLNLAVSWGHPLSV